MQVVVVAANASEEKADALAVAQPTQLSPSTKASCV